MRYAAIFAFLAWSGLFSPALTQGEVLPTNDAPQVLKLPPKPAGLTTSATIGQPEIHFSTKLAKLYDADALANQVGASLGNILNESQRFVLADDDHSEYRCKIAVNDLEIDQLRTTNKTAMSAVSGWFTKIKPGGALSMLTNVDFAQEGLNMTIKCTVAMQFLRGPSRQLVAGGAGRVDETGSTKSVALEVSGKSLLAEPIPGEATAMPTNSFDFQCRIVELAAFRALSELLPELDKRLEHPSEAVAIVHETSEAPARAAVTEAVTTTAATGLTCPHCGKPIAATDKFCPNCGQALPRFCVNCGKPLAAGEKFCPNCGHRVGEP